MSSSTPALSPSELKLIEDPTALEQLAIQFPNFVTLKTRQWRLHTYRECFVGKEAVDALVNLEYASSRLNAVLIARTLSERLGLFEHVTCDHVFEDKEFFYRFRKTHYEGKAAGSHGGGKQRSSTTSSSAKTWSTEFSSSSSSSVMVMGRRRGGGEYSKGTSSTTTIISNDTTTKQEEVDDTTGDDNNDYEGRVERSDNNNNDDNKEQQQATSLQRMSLSQIIQNDDTMSYIRNTLLQSLKVKDRRYQLILYRNSFLGCDVIDLFITEKFAKTRDKAVHLGRVLNRKYDLFEHVTNSYELEDSYLFYRFKRDNDDDDDCGKSNKTTTGGGGEENDHDDEDCSSTDDMKRLSEISQENRDISYNMSIQVAKTLRTVPIADRWYHAKLYRNCFIARDAIDILLQSNLAETRDEAVLLALVAGERFDLYEHVVDKKDGSGRVQFDDAYLFFRFKRSLTSALISRDSTPTIGGGSDGGGGVGGGGGGSVRQGLNYSYISVDQKRVSSLWEHILRKVEVKDQVYRLCLYKRCFVGSDMVDLMVQRGLAKSRSEAVRLGRVVNAQLDLFEHCLGEHDFEDGMYFYRFKTTAATTSTTTTTS